MPQKRLAIDLSEILHLEIYCGSCEKLSILSIKDKKGISIGTNQTLPFNACPSCHKPFTETANFQDALDKIREGLLLHSSVQGKFAIRLIVQK
jgi:hypothetical protein